MKKYFALLSVIAVVLGLSVTQTSYASQNRGHGGDDLRVSSHHEFEHFESRGREGELRGREFEMEDHNRGGGQELRARGFELEHHSSGNHMFNTDEDHTFSGKLSNFNFPKFKFHLPEWEFEHGQWMWK